MFDHEQAKVFYPGYEEVIEVDTGIAPLLLALWDAGVMTCNSCQENEPGVMWIEFYSAEDAENFITLLMVALRDQIVRRPEGDDWLYLRILGEDGEEREPWRYEVHPNVCREHLNSDAFDLDISALSAIAFTVSIRFPAADYPKVLELLSNCLARTS